MTLTPGQSTAERDKLERELSRSLDSLAAEFLQGVYEEARDALGSDVLLAAANPFAYTNIVKRWRATVRTLAEKRPQDTDLLDLLDHSNFPEYVYKAATDVLTKSRDEGWTEYKTKVQLGKALIPAKGAATNAQIRTMARTAATRTHGRRTAEDLDARGSQKRWVAHHDIKTRPTHLEASGQTVDADQPFTVGGYSMAYPGDPSAPPEMTANCRCVLAEVPAPEEAFTPPDLPEVSKLAWTAPVVDYEDMVDITFDEETGRPIFTPTGEKREIYAKVPPRLREEEEMYVRGYADDSVHQRLSEGLRSGRISVPIVPPSWDKDALGYGIEDEDQITALDAAIQRRKTTERAVVYRGMASFTDLKPGEVFEDKAYVSTTATMKYAEEFAQLRSTGSSGGSLTETSRGVTGGKPQVATIILPEGTPILQVDSGVDEYVLMRGTKFHVVAVSDNEVILEVVS